MNILGKIATGAACGGVVGFAIGSNASNDNGFIHTPSRGEMAAVLSGTGAVLGAIIGGATEVSKRMGTVAIGAILGGVSGFMMGAPVCDALIVGEEISGASVLAAGMCSCIPIAVGIVAGATITKITGVALQAIRDRC